MTFDMEATFGDDYPYFYGESIDDEHSDADTAEILGLLQLPSGSSILDVPCGHGRLSRRLAAAGMEVTGVDLTPAYVEEARADPHLRPGSVTYLEGDIRSLRFQAGCPPEERQQVAAVGLVTHGPERVDAGAEDAGVPRLVDRRDRVERQILGPGHAGDPTGGDDGA